MCQNIQLDTQKQPQTPDQHLIHHYSQHSALLHGRACARMAGMVETEQMCEAIKDEVWPEPLKYYLNYTRGAAGGT